VGIRKNIHVAVALLSFAVLLGFDCPKLWGQATELGQIAGTVTDAQGGTVAGATVQVTNLGTQIGREVKSDTQGSFAVRALVPGLYKVEVQSPNFQTQVQNQIKLDVGGSVTLDFHLTVGQVTQQVEVKAEAALLQTEESSVGTVIGNTHVVELPLNGRDFNNLTRLTPGAVSERPPSG